MPIHQKTLFVLADGEHARFVRPEREDNTLHSSSRAVPEAGHRGEVHHAHATEKVTFAHWVAAQLNDAEATYDQLIIVAPPAEQNLIRGRLAKTAIAKLVGTLPKDLTKVPDNELWPHLREWVRPVHRAV